jgi:O-antigen ligase
MNGDDDDRDVSRSGTMNLDGIQTVTDRRLTGPVPIRTRILTGVLAAALLAALATAVTVTGQLAPDDASVTPKAYHVLLILAGAAMLLRGRIPRPRTELLLYFGVTISATLLAYLVYEPRVAAVKLLIALYAALVGASVGRVVGGRFILQAARAAGVVFLIAVTVKNAQYVPAFISYLARPFGHPEVPSLAGGGLNLEATWLALASFFLIGSALFVPFALAAAATSALYATRAGLVIVGLAMCAAVAHAWAARKHVADSESRLGVPTPSPDSESDGPASDGRRRGRTSRTTLRRVATLTLACLAVGGMRMAIRTAGEYGDTTYVAQRFSDIGEEPGSLGRMTLWRGGLLVFAENPMGVGAGNAVPMLRRVLGVAVPEDNLHNIYLQHAVETGLPGLAALLVFAVVVALRVVRSRFRDQLLLFVAGYLVAGVIQFTGVDAVLWLVYGLQSGASGAASDA